MARSRFEKNPDIEKKASRTAGVFCWNNCNFLSGTVCPAPANTETLHIEDPVLAFELFEKYAGDIEVILQPKYMGSRATMTLFRDFEKSYANSRNGFKLEPLGFIMNGDDEEAKAKELARHEKIKAALKDQWVKAFDPLIGWASDDVEAVLIDAELMPWRIIGQDLIEREFVGHYNVNHRENQLLEEYGFNNPAFVSQKSQKIYDETIERNKLEADNLEDYLYQVNLFGSSGDVHFKPFNILKYVYKDGSEEIVMGRNHENYEIVGEDISVTCKLSELLESEEYERFIKYIEEEELEGFVIKPAVYDDATPNGIPPYIKVRNVEYLRIIYGPNYDLPKSLPKLVKNKNIGKKLSASIKQYRMGLDLLAFPLADVKPDSRAYYKKCRDFFADVFYSEEEIDSRL